MAPVTYVVVPVPGLKRSDRRAIAFLTCDDDPDVDGMAAFQMLSKKRERELKTRFDYWIDGKRQDNYFHGWPNEPDNKDCFVFKWKEKNIRHRLYGFLFNPKPTANPSFRVCVLVSHGTKAEWKTDPHHKSLAKGMRAKQAVIDAIMLTFPDSRGGEKSWVN